LIASFTKREGHAFTEILRGRAGTVYIQFPKKTKHPIITMLGLLATKKLNVKQTTLSKIHSTAFFTKKKTNLFDGGWIWTFLAANLYTKHQSQQKGPHPQALSQRRRAIEPRATAMSASFHPAS